MSKAAAMLQAAGSGVGLAVPAACLLAGGGDGGDHGGQLVIDGAPATETTGSRYRAGGQVAAAVAVKCRVSRVHVLLCAKAVALAGQMQHQRRQILGPRCTSARSLALQVQQPGGQRLQRILALLGGVSLGRGGSRGGGGLGEHAQRRRTAGGDGGGAEGGSRPAGGGEGRARGCGFVAGCAARISADRGQGWCGGGRTGGPAGAAAALTGPRAPAGRWRPWRRRCAAPAGRRPRRRSQRSPSALQH